MRYKQSDTPRIAQILKEDDSDWYILITPYDPDFIRYLKGVISWKRRKWNAEKKYWTFAPEYLMQVFYYCRKNFEDVIGDSYVNAILDKKLGEIADQDSYGVMFLKDSAPDWLVEKVYKILLTDDRSEYRHPDKGGDPNMTVRLTMAMDKIKERDA